MPSSWDYKVPLLIRLYFLPVFLPSFLMIRSPASLSFSTPSPFNNPTILSKIPLIWHWRSSRNQLRNAAPHYLKCGIGSVTVRRAFRFSYSRTVAFSAFKDWALGPSSDLLLSFRSPLEWWGLNHFRRRSFSTPPISFFLETHSELLHPPGPLRLKNSPAPPPPKNDCP